MKHKLPTLTVVESPTRAGLLMAYIPSYAEMFRRAGVLTGKVLTGANPGDLPVELATKIELVINLKTARAIGLTIPRDLLFRADKVIE